MSSDICTTKVEENNCDNICAGYRSHTDNLICESKKKDPISWETFNFNQEKYSGCLVLIKNSDFKNGTLRIRYSAVLRLTEDIEFNPETPDYEAIGYDHPEYDLGFFSAIALEGENIVVDLNGHTLQQSVAHALQQRFFALIELANQPFLPHQGPHHFGDEIRPCKNCSIIRGYLGRSSHHGIHGNGVENIYISRVGFQNFEIAAISINGFRGVCVESCRAKKNRHDIPVNATYSASRFIRNPVNKALEIASALEIEIDLINTLKQARDHLVTLMNDSTTDIISTGSINQELHPEAFNLYANPSGLIDGTCYGFLFNGKGVAVDGFASSHTNPDMSEHLYIKGCKVEEIFCEVKEVVCLMHSAENKPQLGPVGETLRISDIVDSDGKYRPTALSQVQILLAELVSKLPEEHSSKFGTLNIDLPVRNWALRSTPESIVDLISDGTLRYIHCGDSMFHANKGAVGIRIDATNHGILHRVKSEQIINKGIRFLPNLPGEKHSYEEYHPKQYPQIEHMGANATGVSIAYCGDITIEKLQAKEIKSVNGCAYGINIFNECKYISGDYVHIKNVCGKFSDDSHAFRISGDSEMVDMEIKANEFIVCEKEEN